MALDAALEVNDHLRQQVEEKGSLALSLGSRMKALENRYDKMLERAHELEQQVSAITSIGDVTGAEVCCTAASEACLYSDSVFMRSY